MKVYYYGPVKGDAETQRHFFELCHCHRLPLSLGSPAPSFGMNVSHSMAETFHAIAHR